MTINDKKYRVPIEMDKEYAAQVGIDPSEITYIMLEGKRTSVYFVEIEDEQLYHELVRCDGNCAVCPHVKSGTPISLDAMEETGGFRSVQDGVHRQQDSATYTASAAEIVEDAMLLDVLWAHIGELSEENRTIITMFSEGATETEIAQAVGMKQTTVSYRKRQILKNLKKILEDFC